MYQKYQKCALKIISVSQTLITSIAYAANPASKEYVDQKAAYLQATANAIQTQINTLQTQINTLKTIPAVAHPVGSCYGGGVVYYASSDANAPAGQRGLIAAPTDALSSTTMQWQSGGSTTVTPTPQKTYFTGEANTNAIRSAIGIFPAASAANSYTVDGDTCTACTSWYLPSQDELATLYAQSTSSIALGDTTFWSACGGSTPGAVSYWSSTQGTLSSQAFSVNFLTGIVTTSTNSSNFRVRAVRAF